jgi:hypothetical protein
LESQQIAWCFFSTFNANFLDGMLCGFFSAKRKLFRLSFALQQFELSFQKFGVRNSHFTAVNPPKMFPFLSKITVRVFA